MGLLTAVLGWVLRKIGLLGLLVLVLFVGYLLVQVLVPAVRDAAADRERLAQVREQRAALQDDLDRLESSAAEGESATVDFFAGEVAARVEQLGDDVAAERSDVARAVEERDEVCGFVAELADALLFGGRCEDAERVAQAAEDGLVALEETLADAEDDAAVLADPTLSPEQKLDRIGEGGGLSFAQREIETTEAQLDVVRAEQEALEESQRSPAGWVVDQWARSWRWVLTAAVLVLLLPPAFRALSYFVLMPVVARVHRPLRLADGHDRPDAALHTSGAERTLRIDLDVDQVLSARSEYVRPVQGRTRSRLLYRWSSPFISYAAGLFLLSRVTGDGGVTSATIASPDPDVYLMRIDFRDHPGVVVHPRHVVGVVGDPDLRTSWRWRIQSLATWQVRYIMFAGAGSLVVQGTGDVVATDPRGRSTRMEQHLVMGFDSRLVKRVNRTEVFLPYLRGTEPLVDDDFTGHHMLFWQKSSTAGPTNPLARTFNSLFSAIGKVLGF